MNAATAMLVPLFVVAVIFAALAVVRLIRTWREAQEGTAIVDDPERLALEDEKQRLLATLRDLDQEHAMGKLSGADHEGLRRHFERETLKTMDRLEALQRERRGEEAHK